MFFPTAQCGNTNGVQRGSVMDFPSTSPGDPLTPGYRRRSRRQTPFAQGSHRASPKFPSCPFPSGDALPLLAELKGPLAPEGWRGALPITYHLGPGPAKVHLKLEFNWDIKPVYDVIAGSRAAPHPMNGSFAAIITTPGSTALTIPSPARSACSKKPAPWANSLKQGWKPRRTIIYCSWDGEEPMLLGSTEWVETHADELRQHAVAYINSDDTGRGFLNLEGSHILENLINTVAHDIADPEVNMNIWKRVQASRIAGAGSAAERREIRDHADLQLDALGSAAITPASWILSAFQA